MKICVTASGDTLESQVDPKFGRCQYFQYIDSETMDQTTEENTFRDGQGGVGVKVAQHLVTQGVEAIISGNIGPNASDVLDAAELPVYAADSKSVAAAVEAWKNGELEQLGA